MTATDPRLPGGGNPPRIELATNQHDRLVLDTPAHVRRDRWMACLQLDGVGSWRHHGDADHAEQIAVWLTNRPAAPLAVGALVRLDSRLTLAPLDDDTLRVRIEYLIANGAVSTGVITLTRQHADQWAAWLRHWLDAHPAPVGQLDLFPTLSAAAA